MHFAQEDHLLRKSKQIFSFLQILEMTFLLPCRYLFFPPDFVILFGALQYHAMLFVVWQISHKYSLIYVITKLGLLFVYDLDTATAVYRNRISPDPIFLTAEASSVGGFYAINRRGQVLLATVNEATIVPFVSGQVC